MLRHYGKVAWRNLRRHRGATFVNIAGLSAGMACAILILLWVRDEQSFDRFHEHAAVLHRIVVEARTPEADLHAPLSPAPLGPAAEQQLPEVVRTARLLKLPRDVVRVGDRSFYEDHGLIADPALFELFTFPFVRGDPRTALADPSGVVLTESMARKYFGSDDPLQKTLRLGADATLTVTGILRDLPSQSHLRFDFVLSFDVLRYAGMDTDRWDAHAFVTYVQLRPGADPAATAHRLTALYHRHQPGDVNLAYALQPVTQIHLGAPLQRDPAVLGDRRYVDTFAAIALLVLFIAGVNFVNLSTARAAARLREVGVRKVLGARRVQLVRQYFLEALLTAMLALVGAVACVEGALPAFNRFTGKSLVLPYTDFPVMLGLLAMATAVGLGAGSYAAVHLSARRPVEALRGVGGGSGQRGHVRRVLVVTQFALSVALMIGALTVYRQFDYLRHANPGFDRAGVVYVPLKGNLGSVYPHVKETLLRHPAILGVTAASRLPTADMDATTWVDWEGRAEGHTLGTKSFGLGYSGVDFDFFETLGMELVEGRAFSPQYGSDATAAYVLNETARAQMGLREAVGKRMVLMGQEGVVVGVAKDAHFQSLRYATGPHVYTLARDPAALQQSASVLLVKIDGADAPGALAAIEATWLRVNPELPFEYQFLDAAIEHLYGREAQTSAVFNFFAVLAIGISCLGLFALATFMVEQRTKEMGVRKVFGSSVYGLVVLLAYSFARWVFAANVLAWPVAWWAARRWLQGYAYHVTLDAAPFLLAGGMALVVALLTVGGQVIRAARTNPVEALRYE